MASYITILGETNPSSTAKVFEITLDRLDFPENFTPQLMLEEVFGHSDFAIDDVLEVRHD